jgi:hypothetical protein
MAALLLLMLGSSIIFVRAKPRSAGNRVSVTERGIPELAAEEPRASKGAVEPRAPAGGRALTAPPSPTTTREAPSPDVASEPRAKMLDRAEAPAEVAAGARARSAAAGPASPAVADDVAANAMADQGNRLAD